MQLGLAAASYELSSLVKHIAKRHPVEGVVLGLVGGALIAWGGPKVWRSLMT